MRLARSTSCVAAGVELTGAGRSKSDFNVKSPESLHQWMGGNTGEFSGDLTGLQDKTSPIITRTLMR